MGTLRIISPDGHISDAGYEAKEPPLEMLQKAAGGYVEHLGVDYNGKRRSAYVVDPYAKPPEHARPDVWPPRPNRYASTIVGLPIIGPLVIVMGSECSI